MDTEPVDTYYVDMNLTLAVDRKVVERARKAAAAMGMSLNQAVREFLVDLAGGATADEEIAELRALSERADGHSAGWEFDRDELHERS